MSVFLPSLKKNGHLDRIHMTICNVGSRKLTQQDDYADKGWKFFAPNLTIYGFDADSDACDTANIALETQQINWVEKHIPLALGSAIGESTLYVTRHPMCSSLYPPNEPYLAQFDGLPELVNLDFSMEIETTTLDNFCQEEGIKTIDFLQIDVQGADLQVLEGAVRALKESVLAVQIEVEFSYLYIGQPLFADVDTYLRAHHFTLFDLLTSYRSRINSPIISNLHPGQILWADAFYFLDLLQASEAEYKSPERLFKLACVADVLNFSDYALHLLHYLTLNFGSDPNYNFADNIVEGLAQFPEIIGQELKNLAVINSLQDYVTQPTQLLKH